ncbi:hypothetical protein I4F81_008838 [Pyropia yezoensis]|uniref:Uncharacterized protein n=1 Tax=Pyropia yezoensis TaxID=2788 RepID=A0ACC3C8B5_PYRYE|nr:hypothetical protein I4F81_008838 [Neopyropia yezoensis]
MRAPPPLALDVVVQCAAFLPPSPAGGTTLLTGAIDGTLRVHAHRGADGGGGGGEGGGGAGGWDGGSAGTPCLTTAPAAGGGGSGGGGGGGGRASGGEREGEGDPLRALLLPSWGGGDGGGGGAGGAAGVVVAAAASGALYRADLGSTHGPAGGRGRPSSALLTLPAGATALAAVAAAVVAAGDDDGGVHLVDLRARGACGGAGGGAALVGTASEHGDYVSCLLLAADGVTLLSGSGDGTVGAWDVRGGTGGGTGGGGGGGSGGGGRRPRLRAITPSTGDDVLGVARLGRGGRLAAGTLRGAVHVYEAAAMAAAATAEPPPPPTRHWGHPGSVDAVVAWEGDDGDGGGGGGDEDLLLTGSADGLPAERVYLQSGGEGWGALVGCEED